MPVFKNEDNGTWYVMARYVNLDYSQEKRHDIGNFFCGGGQIRSA